MVVDASAGEIFVLQKIVDASGLGDDIFLAHQLKIYIDLLIKWNGTYNLTAIRDRQSILTHHIADCLAVIKPLQQQMAVLEKPANHLLDVGSGAGLPGILLALAFSKMKVVCVDSVKKKTSFINQVAIELKLKNLISVQGRIESLALPKFAVITARAFASLEVLVDLTFQHLAPGGIYMAMQGKAAVAQSAVLPHGIEVFHQQILEVPQLNANRCLVWMRAQDRLFDEDCVFDDACNK